MYFQLTDFGEGIARQSSEFGARTWMQSHFTGQW